MDSAPSHHISPDKNWLKDYRFPSPKEDSTSISIDGVSWPDVRMSSEVCLPIQQKVQEELASLPHSKDEECIASFITFVETHELSFFFKDFIQKKDVLTQLAVEGAFSGMNVSQQFEDAVRTEYAKKLSPYLVSIICTHFQSEDFWFADKGLQALTNTARELFQDAKAGKEQLTLSDFVQQIRLPLETYLLASLGVSNRHSDFSETVLRQAQKVLTQNNIR